MKNIIITVSVWILALNHLTSQDLFLKPKYTNLNLSEKKQESLIQSLDSLFKQIKENRLDKKYIASNKANFTFSILEEIQSYEINKENFDKKVIELINNY